MREFLSYYSDKYDKVNEDVITKYRIEDDMVDKIEEICINFSKKLKEYVTYTGYRFDDNRTRFKEVNASSKKKDSKTGRYENKTYINVNYTYSRMCIFSFDIKFIDPCTKNTIKSKLDMPIYIPQFIDPFHYFIRGNKYSAPYQLTDATTYLGRNDSVILKTLTQALKMSRKQVEFKDVHGEMYKSYAFYFHLSNKKVPFILYYFAWFGFFNSLMYFGVDNYIRLYTDYPNEVDPNIIYFKFCKLYLGVNREKFENIYELKQLVCTILSLSKKSLDIETIRDALFWRQMLGSYISSTSSLERGANVLITFYTSLDERTLKNLNTSVGGKTRRDAFAVGRWMFMNYSQLSNKNTSLRNKRLRYTEYLVTPLIREMSQRLFRFLKTKSGEHNYKKLTDIFKVPQSIITNAIIGKTRSRAQNIDVANFSNQVNDNVLPIALKFTRGGPGTAIERVGKRAGALFRQNDPSCVGQIDLITTSSGSGVGISGVLTPFADVEIKNDILSFDIK